MKMGRSIVLVKSYYGLGGDICVLLGAWRLARQLGRDLVVDWSGGRYGSVPNGDLFHQFFSEPGFLAPSDVPDLASATVFPQEWSGRAALPPVTYLADEDLTKSRPDDVPLDCPAQCIVITRDSRHLVSQIGEYGELLRMLKLRPEIQSVVSEQVHQLKEHRYSIGIHFRHGNGERKVMAPDPRWFRNRINGKLKQRGLEPAQFALFVATDCLGTLEYFKRYYPHVVSIPKAYRPNGSGAMHVGRSDLTDEEKMRMAGEALADMYTLAQCDAFVGSRGYFSLVPRLLRHDRDTVIYPGVRVINHEELAASSSAATHDSVFGPVLRRMRLPTDGLLCKVSSEKRALFYYEDLIISVPPEQTALSAEEQLSMRRLITARRTY